MDIFIKCGGRYFATAIDLTWNPVGNRKGPDYHSPEFLVKLYLFNKQY